MPYELVVPGHKQVQFPPVCSCCLAPVEAGNKQHHKERLFSSIDNADRRALSVPLCPPCQDHFQLEAGARENSFLLGAALFLGWIIATAMLNRVHLRLWKVSVLSLVILAAAALAWYWVSRRWKEKPVPPGHAENVSLWSFPLEVAFTPDYNLRFFFGNREFAREFSKLNGIPEQEVKPPSAPAARS